MFTPPISGVWFHNVEARSRPRMYCGSSPSQVLSVMGDTQGPRSSDRKVSQRGKMGLCKEVRWQQGSFQEGPQVRDSQSTVTPACNEWSRLLSLPHPLSQAASVAFLVHSRNVPLCRLSVSSSGLSCLPASPPSPLRPRLSSDPPMAPITGGHVQMSQLTKKPSMDCCLLTSYMTGSTS